MKKKILVVLLVLVFLYCIGGVIYSVIVKQNDVKENISKVITIKNYEYKIDEDKETSLYKDEFNSLKSNLESEIVDLKKYATSIAKLYIIDLYTLSTKSNKYDITSSQYVYLLGRENYNLKVSETLYKFIEDNTSGRDQELPEVSEIIVNNIEESIYMIGSNEYPSYTVDLEWLYKKDLGYDTNATITLVNENNLISVVEQKNS